jgi:hypothetical protein
MAVGNIEMLEVVYSQKFKTKNYRAGTSHIKIIATSS